MLDYFKDVNNYDLVIISACTRIYTLESNVCWSRGCLEWTRLVHPVRARASNTYI